MMKTNREKHLTEFATLMCKLDAASALGLARQLNVKLFYDDIKDEKGMPMPRGGEAILEETVLRFNALDRAERRRILKLLKQAVRG